MQSPIQAVKERPILFSGAMVRAILEGRKTQTRRIVKPPRWALPWGYEEISLWDGKPTVPDDNDTTFFIECPYGQAGDRLWVRETHAYLWNTENPNDGGYYEYRADNPHDKYPGGWPDDEAKGNEDAPKWKPSIFMPRAASRILLEIVRVRVERLQDISGTDAVAEGCGPLSVNGIAQQTFLDLWNQINGTGAYYRNPWVWVVEFKRVDPA